ncbi:hypothetical protein [Pedococcus sp. 5OH_020]|uniref:hypothetical protein n=1 Tax=Pedococcus sp. 5OH_020 TaxID=2989814 RepID=UPI0022E9DCAF|nr:hypothetical protein [Pedococcus sp. 5OH_020]
MRQRLARLSAAQQLMTSAVVAVLVGTAAVTVPALAGVGLLLACLALVASFALLAQWLWQSQRPTDWSNRFAPTTPPRGVDSRVDRLAGDLHRCAEGDADSAARLHAVLAGLAHERLRDRRGIEADQDPDGATSALGPDLTAYLGQPPTSPVAADRLARLVTRLEEL